MSTELVRVAETVAAVATDTEAYGQYILDEMRAQELSIYCDGLLPGSLQTSDVARSILQSYRPEAQGTVIETLVTARMRRASHLVEHQTPITYFIDQRVLGATPERSYWQQQLRHVIDIATRPWIELRVIPEETYHVAQDMTTLLTRADGDRWVYAEAMLHQDMYTNERTVVKRTDEMFQSLAALALQASQSIDLIKEHYIR
jgi:hypothetical protein